jgi:SAM-dependent methyltransferase
LINIFSQVRKTSLNLFDIFVSVISKKITLRYGFIRLRSQLLFTGKRFIDGVNWDSYHKDYIEELRLIEKTNTTLLDGKNIQFIEGRIHFKNVKTLPLLAGHKLLYETICDLPTNRILEVGCGGGDHLYNLRQLKEESILFGIDRSEKQILLFEKRHKFFKRSVKTYVYDLTQSNLELPKVDLIFTQAVLMHISEVNNRFFIAFNNLFTESNSYIVLMENWTQHDFLETALKIIKDHKFWSSAKIYFTESEIDPSVKCMVISKSELALRPLTNYEQMLSREKLMIH